MRGLGIGVWLRTLGSGAIAALGLAVLWDSWPDRGGAIAKPGDDPWTVAVDAGWVPESPEDLPWTDPEAEGSAGDLTPPEPDPVPLPDPDPPPVETRLYTVRKGDSLWRIAERELGSHRRQGEIVRWNPGIEGRTLHPGVELVLPPTEGSSAAPSPPPREIIHRVRKGESLGRIGKRYGVSAERIFAANRDQLRSIDRVRIGQSLRIPAAEGGTR